MRGDKDSEIDWPRLDRYVRGVGTAYERAQLEAWVNGDPRLRTLADTMRAVGPLIARPTGWPDARRALAKVKRQAGLVQTPRAAPRLQEWERRGRRSTRERIVTSGLLSMAAAVGILVAVQQYTPPPAPVVPPREVATKAGQRASVKLPDGTEVVLSADSRIVYAADIGTGASPTREVSLTGEAAFVVQHDSLHPFVVRTSYGTAEDLGTEFIVNTYPEARGMRLAVREGRVALRMASTNRSAPRSIAADSAVAILSRGDIAQVGATGDLTVSRRQDVSAAFARSEGSLVMRSVLVGDAIPQLERWFGITIRVTDPTVLGRRVSGTFRDESAREALAILGVVLDQDMRWTGTTVTLKTGADRRDPP